MTAGEAEEPLTLQNIEQYLSLFEDCLHETLPAPITSAIAEPTSRDIDDFTAVGSKKNIQTPSEDIRRYSKAPPTIPVDDLKEKAEEKLIDGGKLREYATEYWEKRKEQTVKNVKN